MTGLVARLRALGSMLAPRTAPRATAWYVLLTLAATWPLPTRLASRLPWDLGDSLLNCWILSWNLARITRLLHGDWSALDGFWDGNIFHPDPLALAYSELLIAQTVQVLPVQLLTGNILLGYNLLFLSSYVLSGTGTWLLVRQITGDTRAAFIAGLLFAFHPYRVDQGPHLQVLSMQWMPFTLYALRRHFDTGRAAPLAGAALALTANNLSCGYLMLYFAPPVAAYCLFEIARRRLWTAARTWIGLAATAAASFAVTVPFLLPYLQLREIGGRPRSLVETIYFSADLFAYGTADGSLRLWGWMQAFPRPEGDLFPGMTAMLLSGIALGVVARAAWRDTHGMRLVPAARRWRTPALVLLGVALALGLVHLSGAIVLLTGGRGRYTFGPIVIQIRDLLRPLLIVAASVAATIAVSPRARAVVSRLGVSLPVFLAVCALVAAWLSLGPEMRVMGRRFDGMGLYGLLFRFVPGYDGLRVAARFATVAFLCLSVLGGLGAASIGAIARRGGTLILAVLAVTAYLDGFAAPLPLNGVLQSERFLPPSWRVAPIPDAPAVYRYLATLPKGTAIAHFPFGDETHEIRYLYYSAAHWHPILNGYSGGMPQGYARRASLLRNVARDSDRAWEALVSAGATHAVVHTNLFDPAAARAVTNWLSTHGAREVASFGTDRVYELPRQPRDASR